MAFVYRKRKFEKINGAVKSMRKMVTEKESWRWPRAFGFNICVTSITRYCDKIVTNFIWEADKVHSVLQIGPDAE